VEVPAGQASGFEVRADALVVPAGARDCRVRASDAGVPDDAPEGEVALAVDGAAIGEGEWYAVPAAPGTRRDVRVNLTYTGVVVREPSPPRPGRRGPGDSEPLSLPVTLSLAAVFAVGLLGAVVRSRRAH
jgi:hypothetical protein